MKTTIYVLKKDLNDPDCLRSNNEDCPIARGLRRIVKADVFISVVVYSFHLSRYPGGTYDGTEISIPGCKGGIVLHRDCKPFRFTVDIPTRYLKRKAVRK